VIAATRFSGSCTPAPSWVSRSGIISETGSASSGIQACPHSRISSAAGDTQPKPSRPDFCPAYGIAGQVLDPPRCFPAGLGGLMDTHYGTLRAGSEACVWQNWLGRKPNGAVRVSNSGIISISIRRIESHSAAPEQARPMDTICQCAEAFCRGSTGRNGSRKHKLPTRRWLTLAPHDNRILVHGCQTLDPGVPVRSALPMRVRHSACRNQGLLVLRLRPAKPETRS